MSKKVVKLAIIRKNNLRGCPFGLDILNGCKNAGELIQNMAPLDLVEEDEEKQDIMNANRRLFNWQAPCQRCSYAGKIINQKNAVECNYGSNAAGISQDAPIAASPFYSKVYNNVSLDGLNATPIGYYADNNISRNLFYGIYSLQGSENKEDLVKLAEKILRNIIG